MKKELICANCGTIAKPKTKTQGSILIEAILWICLILPGLLYSLHRLTTRKKVCRRCGSENLVPVQTPKGQKLVADFG